jgi:hypothetical protein
MTSKVLIKRSNVAGKIPTPPDLQIGELAMNFQDLALYTKEPGGTIVQLCPNPLPANALGMLTNNGFGGLSWAPAPSPLPADVVGVLKNDGAGHLSWVAEFTPPADAAGVLTNDGSGAITWETPIALPSDAAGLLSNDGAGNLSWATAFVPPANAPGALINDGTGTFTWQPLPTDAIISDPPVGTSQSITAADPADVPLALVGATGQTADLLQVDTDKLVVKADGAVGIGTNAPAFLNAYKLTVDGKLRATNNLVLSNNAGLQQLTTGSTVRNILNLGSDDKLRLFDSAGAVVQTIAPGEVSFDPLKGTGIRMVVADANGKLEDRPMLTAGMKFVGAIDPATMPATQKNGDFIVFNKAGTVGGTAVSSGDMAVYFGTKWEIIPAQKDLSAYYTKPQSDGRYLRAHNGVLSTNMASSRNVTFSGAAGTFKLTGIKSTGNRMLYLDKNGSVLVTAMPYTLAQNDARYLKLTGGTLTGALTIANNKKLQFLDNKGGVGFALYSYSNGVSHFDLNHPMNIRGTGSKNILTFDAATQKSTFSGAVRMVKLAGTGNRMVYANASGDLLTTAMPPTVSYNDKRYLRLAGGTVSGRLTLTASSGSRPLVIPGLKSTGNQMLYIDKNGSVLPTAMPLTTAQNDSRYWRLASSVSYAHVVTLTAGRRSYPLRMPGLKSTVTQNLVIDKNGYVTVAAMPRDTHDWAHITGKPSSFPSTWATVSGKPAVVDRAGSFKANHLVYSDTATRIRDSGVVCYPSRKYMEIPAGWKLGVGVVPAQALHVNGQIIATNDITAFYSDVRLKENIQPLGNALGKVCALNGFTYTANQLAVDSKAVDAADKDKQRVGVAAQDVEKVLPEAVSQAPFDMAEGGGSKTGNDYKTVQYEKLVPLLVEAIKELKAEIEELKNGR